MTTVYVVVGRRGEYSDRTELPNRVFSTREGAQQYVDTRPSTIRRPIWDDVCTRHPNARISELMAKRDALINSLGYDNLDDEWEDYFIVECEYEQ